jgi:hypothetical protein
MKTEEIRQLKESKEWKSRADPYLRKRLHKKETVIQNLSSWLMKWKNKCDPDDQELCPNHRSPCPDFRPNYRPQKKNPSKKAIQEQKKKKKSWKSIIYYLSRALRARPPYYGVLLPHKFLESTGWQLAPREIEVLCWCRS